MSLTFNEYQDFTTTLGIYRLKPGGKVIYPALEIAGEAGEVCDKIKKLIRDGNGIENISDDMKQNLILELGDIMFGIASLAYDLGYEMDDVAQMNIDKLTARAQKGTLSGSGDHR